MTSETKVPMPELPPEDGTLELMLLGEPREIGAYRASTMVDFAGRYGDARASERDAFWMAKVAELVARSEQTIRSLYAVNHQCGLRASEITSADKKRGLKVGQLCDDCNEMISAHMRDLTNPRAGETA